MCHAPYGQTILHQLHYNLSKSIVTRVKSPASSRFRITVSRVGAVVYKTYLIGRGRIMELREQQERKL